jgi:hypothetical protein
VLLAMGAGYLAWMAFKFAHGYLQTNRFNEMRWLLGLNTLMFSGQRVQSATWQYSD